MDLNLIKSKTNKISLYFNIYSLIPYMFTFFLFDLLLLHQKNQNSNINSKKVNIININFK